MDKRYSSFSDTAQQQRLLELKDLLQRAKSQSLTDAEKFGLITSGVVTTAIIFITLLWLASMIIAPNVPGYSRLGFLLFLISSTIGFIPYSRGKQAVKDRYVKTITQGRFDTTKELEAEIESLQKLIGNQPWP